MAGVPPVSTPGNRNPVRLRCSAWFAPGTHRAARVVFHHCKLFAAVVADAALRTDLRIQLQALHSVPRTTDSKQKLSESTSTPPVLNAQAYARWPRSGMTHQLLAYGLQNRFAMENSCMSVPCRSHCDACRHSSDDTAAHILCAYPRGCSASNKISRCQPMLM